MNEYQQITDRLDRIESMLAILITSLAEEGDLPSEFVTLDGDPVDQTHAM